MSILLGYVRVSGKAQAGKDEDGHKKDGPERQELAIAKFCDQNSYPVPTFFSDLGVSGTIEGLDRPGFLAMLDAAEKMNATGIVIEKLERLARDLMVSELLIRELAARNLMLFATDQGASDLVKTELDPTRTLVRQLFAALAQYEKSALVVKLRVARERKKKATGKCEGKRAFGEGDEAVGKVERIMLNTIAQLRKVNEVWSKENRPASWNTIATMFQNSDFKKRNSKTNWTASQLCAIWKRHQRRQRKKGNNEHLPSKYVFNRDPEIASVGNRGD